MKTLLNTLLILIVPATALASDYPDRLMMLLNIIDRHPSAEQLVAAGAGEQGQRMIEVALDEQLKRYPRTRAVALLVQFDNSLVKSALRNIITAQQVTDREVKIQAIASLTALEKNRAVPLLKTLLADRDVELRGASARALGRVNNVEARVALTARLSVEPDARVRKTIQRKLRQSAE